ncbi:MAG: threonine synthase, partial [Clostridia bacterium]|nr:threonine synthase [Clostridia bacterium]
DMALQILPHFLTKAIKKTGEDKKVVILVATSGDTGKAALEGFRDVDGTGIVVFYPNNGVSKIQQLQMATQEGGNVGVVAVNGNFDDAQTGVKKIFTDEGYKAELAAKGFMLSSANSINWGRLAPQIVYYFSAYCDLLSKGDIANGDKINIVVPTGNFGNILAAYYAKTMGLPVNKLICASNSNNVLTEFIKTGVYDRNRKFFTTISPSMDILISSNLERLLYHLSGCDDKLVAEYMGKLNSEGKYQVSDAIFAEIQKLFYAGCCDDDETKATICKINKEFGYTADTHTAVAINVYDKYAAETGDSTKTVIASTANPFKFNESVINAIKGEGSCTGLDEFELLDKLHDISKMEIPASLGQLRNKQVRFKDVCDKEQMQAVTSDFLLSGKLD